MPTIETGRITRMEFSQDEEGAIWLEIQGSKRPPDVYRFPLSDWQLRDLSDDAAFMLEELEDAAEEQQQPEHQEARTAG